MLEDLFYKCIGKVQFRVFFFNFLFKKLIMKVEKVFSLVVLIIGLLIVFIYALNYNPSREKEEIHNIIEKGYVVTVTYLSSDNIVYTTKIETKHPLDFEIIDGCLYITTGINKSIACFVKKIEKIDYVSIYSGKNVYFY